MLTDRVWPLILSSDNTQKAFTEFNYITHFFYGPRRLKCVATQRWISPDSYTAKKVIFGRHGVFFSFFCGNATTKWSSFGERKAKQSWLRLLTKQLYTGPWCHRASLALRLQLVLGRSRCGKITCHVLNWVLFWKALKGKGKEAQQWTDDRSHQIISLKFKVQKVYWHKHSVTGTCTMQWNSYSVHSP